MLFNKFGEGEASDYAGTFQAGEICSGPSLSQDLINDLPPLLQGSAE
jgi:hypothetical protein